MSSHYGCYRCQRCGELVSPIYLREHLAQHVNKVAQLAWKEVYAFFRWVSESPTEAEHV